MRIFYAFVITIAAALLFLVPYTEVGDEFITDLRTDSFSGKATGAAATTVNVTLATALYDDDVQRADVTSDLDTDVPVAATYNASNRNLTVSGLTVSGNRTLDVVYSFDALAGNSAVNTVVSRFPWIMLLCAIVIAPASIGAIFIGRA